MILFRFLCIPFHKELRANFCLYFKDKTIKSKYLITLKKYHAGLLRPGAESSCVN